MTRSEPYRPGLRPAAFATIAFVRRAMDLFDHLTLRTLKLLAAIDESGSLTRASAQVHIVPSAASKRIRALEAAIGFPILERSSRGVTLNPAGRALARYASKIGGDVVELGNELNDLACGVRGKVALSAAASAIAQHLPEDLGAFLSSHPDIRVDLQEHFSNAIVDRLRAGHTDVGVLVSSQPSIAGLELFEYRRETLVVVVSSGHRLAGAQGVAFAELLDEVWIGLPSGTSLASMLDAQARRHGARLRRRIEVYGMDSACRMVQNGLGIALLPSKALESSTRRAGIESVALLEDWAERTLYVAVRADVEHEPACLALVDALVRKPDR